MVHDAHTPGDCPSCVAWLRVKGRSNGLLEIGYNYCVERDGTVVCTRPHQAQGSHTPGHNHYSIGVCLAGGWEAGFTPAQQASLMALVDYLQSEYGGGLQLVGHSEIQRFRRRTDPNRNVQCPAFDMEELRAGMKEYYAVQEQQEAKAPQKPGDKLTPQQELVLDYMRKRGPISNHLAITLIGVASLSKRVSELKAMGFPIETEDKVGYHGNRYVSHSWAGLPEAPR